jgi:peptidoglycan/xylan/chitin deacetylase (PgdA/CDA1 family)
VPIHGGENATGNVGEQRTGTETSLGAEAQAKENCVNRQGSMAESLVCLTFDFDAMSGMVAKGLKSPTAISRGEFGAVAVDRILPLLEVNDIPTSWFIPGTVIKTYPDQCRRIVDGGHEVGNHGWTHVPPTDLTPEQEDEGLERANQALFEISGKATRGYRSTSWDLSPVTVDLLIKHGFLYDSSMMGHDCLPYYARRDDIVSDDEPFAFGPVTSLIEMPVSWSLSDFAHFEYLRLPNSVAPGLANAGHVLDNWIRDFEYMQRTEPGGILTFTLHPFVIGRGHRMMMLEGLITALRERGARFATMEDAALAFRDRANVG